MSSLSGTWSIVSYRKGIETDSPLAIGLQTDKSPGTNVVVLCVFSLIACYLVPQVLRARILYLYCSFHFPLLTVLNSVSNTADENQQWIIKEYKSPIGQTHTVTVQHKVKGWYLAPPTPNTGGFLKAPPPTDYLGLTPGSPRMMKLNP